VNDETENYVYAITL